MTRRSTIIFAASLAVLSAFEPAYGFAAPTPAHEDIERPRFLKREVKRFVFSNTTTSREGGSFNSADHTSDLDRLHDSLTSSSPPAEVATDTGTAETGPSETTSSVATTETPTAPVVHDAAYDAEYSRTWTGLHQHSTTAEVPTTAASLTVTSNTVNEGASSTASEAGSSDTSLLPTITPSSDTAELGGSTQTQSSSSSQQTDTGTSSQGTGTSQQSSATSETQTSEHVRLGLLPTITSGAASSSDTDVGKQSDTQTLPDEQVSANDSQTTNGAQTSVSAAGLAGALISNIASLTSSSPSVGSDNTSTDTSAETTPTHNGQEPLDQVEHPTATNTDVSPNDSSFVPPGATASTSSSAAGTSSSGNAASSSSQPAVIVLPEGDTVTVPTSAAQTSGSAVIVLPGGLSVTVPTAAASASSDIVVQGPGGASVTIPNTILSSVLAAAESSSPSNGASHTDTNTGALAGAVTSVNGEAGGAVTSAVANAGGAVSTVISGAGGALTTIVGGAGGALTTAIGQGAGAVTSVLEGAGGALTTAVGQGAGAVTTVVGGAGGALTTAVGQGAGAVTSAVGGAGGAVSSAVGEGAGAVTSAVGQGAGAVTSAVGQGAGAVTSAVGGVPGAISSAAGEGAGAVTTAVSQGAGAVTSAVGGAPGAVTSVVGQLSGATSAPGGLPGAVSTAVNNVPTAPASGSVAVPASGTNLGGVITAGSGAQSTDVAAPIPTGSQLYAALTSALGATLLPGQTMLPNGDIITTSGLGTGATPTGLPSVFGLVSESGALPTDIAGNITLPGGQIITNPVATLASLASLMPIITLPGGGILTNPFASAVPTVAGQASLAVNSGKLVSLQPDLPVSAAISNGAVIVNPTLTAASLVPGMPVSAALSNGDVIMNPTAGVQTAALVQTNANGQTVVPADTAASALIPVTQANGEVLSATAAPPVTGAAISGTAAPLVVGSETLSNGAVVPVTTGEVTGSSTLTNGDVVPLTAGTPTPASALAGYSTESNGDVVPISTALAAAQASTTLPNGSVVPLASASADLQRLASENGGVIPQQTAQVTATAVGSEAPSPTVIPNVEHYPTNAKGPFTQQPTGYDSLTAVSIPTEILAGPSTMPPTQSQSYGPTGLPTGVPLVLYPPTGPVQRPPNTDVIQVGFQFCLNYNFVWTHEESQQQIFKYLALGIAYGLSIELENVTMQTLRAWDTTAELHFVTTLALAFIPTGLVDSLGLLVQTQTSRFYQNPDDSTKTLVSMINNALPIAADNSTDGDGMPYGAIPTSSTSPKDNGSPIGGSIGSSQPVRASSVGIVAGVACGAAAYGAAMFFVARRYRKRRQSHLRSPSMFSSPVMSHAGPDTMAGAALMSGGIDRSISPYHDEDGRAGSRGSGRSGSSRHQISAPVMAENSLGWN